MRAAVARTTLPLWLNPEIGRQSTTVKIKNPSKTQPNFPAISGDLTSGIIQNASKQKNCQVNMQQKAENFYFLLDKLKVNIILNRKSFNSKGFYHG